MTLPRGRGRGLRTLLLGAATAVVLAGAWMMPSPVRAADDGLQWQGACPTETAPLHSRGPGLDLG